MRSVSIARHSDQIPTPAPLRQTCAVPLLLVLSFCEQAVFHSGNYGFGLRCPRLRCTGPKDGADLIEEPVRLEMTEQLNQLLADTMTLRDLYKKSHWQVGGPSFYQPHLLYISITTSRLS